MTPITQNGHITNSTWKNLPGRVVSPDLSWWCDWRAFHIHCSLQLETLQSIGQGSIVCLRDSGGSAFFSWHVGHMYLGRAKSPKVFWDRNYKVGPQLITVSRAAQENEMDCKEGEMWG